LQPFDINEFAHQPAYAVTDVRFIRRLPGMRFNKMFITMSRLDGDHRGRGLFRVLPILTARHDDPDKELTRQFLSALGFEDLPVIPGSRQKAFVEKLGGWCREHYPVISLRFKRDGEKHRLVSISKYTGPPVEMLKAGGMSPKAKHAYDRMMTLSAEKGDKDERSERPEWKETTSAGETPDNEGGDAADQRGTPETFEAGDGIAGNISG